MRVARRLSVSSSSASRPVTSASPGSSSCSIRATSSPRSTRSARTSESPVGAVWPVVNSRCTTVSTALVRAGSSSGGGTRYGIRAAAIFFFARVSRARHRRLAHQERMCHLGGREPADEPKRQRDLRCRSQRRVAAGEDQPQPVIGKGRDRVGLRAAFGLRPGLDEQRKLARERGLAADRIEGAPPRRRGEPGAGIDGDPAPRPRRQRLGVRLLHALLGKVDVARDAHRRGEHEGPLATVRVGDGGADLLARAGCGRHRIRPT